jgi:hypothetical protein
MKPLVLCMALLLAFAPKLAHSALILDQQQTTVDATTGFLTGVQELAQTFTVGKSGRLGGITIDVAAGLPVTLDLLQVVGGVPTFSILASAVAAGPTSPAFTFFDFTSSDIHVHVGEVLAFAPSVTTSNGQVVGEDISFGSGDPYTGGEEFLYKPRMGITTWQPFASTVTGATHSDIAFETFLAVPEPSAVFIFGGSLMALCVLLRRRVTMLNGRSRP